MEIDIFDNIYCSLLSGAQEILISKYCILLFRPAGENLQFDICLLQVNTRFPETKARQTHLQYYYYKSYYYCRFRE